MLAPSPFEMTLQFPKMIVRENAQDGATQHCSVDERSVTEFVQHDDVILRDQGRDCAERSGISAAETQRSFGPFPFRQRLFQTKMRRLRTANQPRSADANAKFFDRGDCCLSQSRIVCQTEIIVRGNADAPTARSFDFGALCGWVVAKM